MVYNEGKDLTERGVKICSKVERDECLVHVGRGYYDVWPGGLVLVRPSVLTRRV